MTRKQSFPGIFFNNAAPDQCGARFGNPLYTEYTDGLRAKSLDGVGSLPTRPEMQPIWMLETESRVTEEVLIQWQIGVLKEQETTDVQPVTH